MFLAGGARQQRHSANGALGGEGAPGRAHGARLEPRTPLRHAGDAGAEPTGGLGGLGGGEEEVLARQHGDLDGVERERGREAGPKKKRKKEKKKKTWKSSADG